MVFNEIPVLDKGFVAYVSSNMDSKILGKLSQHYFKGKVNPELFELASVTITMRCPIFVNLFLQRFNFKIISVNPAHRSEDDIETYVPDQSSIKTKDCTEYEEIHKHMGYMAENLLVTHKGYLADKCDHFISQVNLPIGTYNEIIVHGSLAQWINFLNAKNLPIPLESYRKTCFDILKADFRNIQQFVRK